MKLRENLEMPVLHSHCNLNSKAVQSVIIMWCQECKFPFKMMTYESFVKELIWNIGVPLAIHGAVFYGFDGIFENS